MSFNEKLQKLRKANNLSQEGLADLLDVTRQSVSKWESGTTYPEMDKLLSMCKIFKCSLDDLTNDDISEIKIEEKKKSNIYTLIDSILDFIRETNELLKSMTKQELASCAFIMGITALILLLFRFPFNEVEKLFYLFIRSTQNDLFRIGSQIIKFIIDCCYWSLFLVIFIYIFRIVYLDNPKYKRKTVLEKEPVEKKENAIKIEEKEIVLKKEKKANNRIDILFRFLEKTVMFFLKLFICFIIIPTLFILFFLCAGLFIYLFLLFKGVFYISILFGIPFSILLTLTILEILIRFVMKTNKNERRLTIMFLVSIVGLGSSFGIFLLDISSVQYVDEIPKGVKMDTITKTYPMADNMYFLFWPEVEYIIDNTKTNEVKVEVDYYKDYMEILLPKEINGSFAYYEKPYLFINQHLLSIIIENLKHRKFYNYGILNEVKIKIYTTEQNIQILKENHQREENSLNEVDRYCTDKIRNYENEISRLEEEKEDLYDQNVGLKNENQELLSSNLDYQNKIEDYKRKLQEIIEE